MKKKITVVFVLFFATSVFAQTANSSNGNYNLPPGFFLHPKRQIYNLAYKIDSTVPVVAYSTDDLKFLQELTNEELQGLDGTPYYQYVQNGNAFIASLSSHVKTLYTNEELWFIYAFDQNLKNRLENIQ